MNDFVPSATFVEKTMETIRVFEAAHQTRPARVFMHDIVAKLLQAGALLAGCGIALANVLRLYYAVFAPVLSH
jgi:hypothetical protein